MPPDQFDVFLSYHWRDHAQVEALARRLQEQDLTVFFDRWYLTPGQSWPKELEATLARCRAVAVCIGQGEMGPWQQREQYLALERQVAAQRRSQNFPVIPVLLPGAEPPLGFLSQNTWVDFRTRSNDPILFNTLVSAIHGQPPGPDAQETVRNTLATICPYRGLLYFREEDAPFFFGREAAITQLVHAVQQHNLVAVVGASGSGKSSVVRAGLVPVLRKSREPVWEVATFVPTDRPLYSLAAVLMPLLEPVMSETSRLVETNKLAEVLLQRTVKLRDIVDRLLAKQAGTDRLLLIVDQWEELFTLCQDDAARRCFIDNVLDATSTARVSVVLTLRGDFFGRAITDYRPLSDRVQGAQVNLGPMKREELRLAIDEPAQKVGLTFEAGLVDLILEQAGDEPGHLPLLEFVLRQLWEQRRGGELHHDAYKAIGQLEGAIAKKAESIYGRMSAQDQRGVQQIFLRLVRPGEGEADTRRRATFAEMGEELRSIVKILADERLLVTSRSAGGAEDTIEVSHEALIRHWQQLKDWVDADRRFLAWQQRLGASIKQYDENKRSSDLLLRGLPLTEAVDWLRKKPDDLSPVEREFVTASKNRKIRDRIAFATIAGLVLMLVGGPLAWSWKKGVTVKYTTSIVLARLHLVSVLEPEMVEIPGGDFQQGDVKNQATYPLRKVTVNRFRIGKYEVTFEEYDRYVELTGSRSPTDEMLGRQRRPVSNVLWEEAVGYAEWLTQATGKRYRLPTEAEWEYAAGSGGKDTEWAGTSDEKELADFAVYNAQRTEPVGGKKPNSLGLYDMSGNVWELVQDCYSRIGEECNFRVARGGSRANKPESLRVSYRFLSNVGSRTGVTGFRLAQDIP
jgi:formylglycine-generating enzyme required for sulfatase activity/energy-coupling factor transporter ATP-binding protein EcfA2